MARYWIDTLKARTSEQTVQADPWSSTYRIIYMAIKKKLQNAVPTGVVFLGYS